MPYVLFAILVNLVLWGQPAIAAIVVFGLGAVVASADAVAPSAPTATQAR